MDEYLVDLVERVQEGKESPLKALAELRMLSKMVTSAIEDIEPSAFKEAESYSEKTFNVFGFKFEVKQGSRRYDYKHIKEWSDLSAKIKEREALYKMAANAYEKGTQIFDEETGEQIPVPKVTYTKASISITEDK